MNFPTTFPITQIWFTPLFTPCQIAGTQVSTGLSSGFTSLPAQHWVTFTADPVPVTDSQLRVIATFRLHPVKQICCATPKRSGLWLCTPQCQKIGRASCRERV